MMKYSIKDHTNSQTQISSPIMTSYRHSSVSPILLYLILAALPSSVDKVWQLSVLVVRLPHCRADLRLGLQRFKVHPLSERLPQFAPWCGNRTRTIRGSHKAMISFGLRCLGGVVLVVQLLEGGLGLTLWVYIEHTQRSIFSTWGGGSSSIIPLELLDDGRKLGIQRWSACFGPCGWTWSASARILFLLVWGRRVLIKRGRERRSGWAGGSNIRLSVRGRRWSASLLAAVGSTAAVAGIGARIRGGGFALGQNTLLHYHWMGTIKQTGPVRCLFLLFMANKEVPICLLNFIVDNISDALKLARWIYTCKGNKLTPKSSVFPDVLLHHYTKAHIAALYFAWKSIL